MAFRSFLVEKSKLSSGAMGRWIRFPGVHGASTCPVVLSGEACQHFGTRSWQCFKSEIRAGTCHVAVIFRGSPITWDAACR